MSLAPVIAGLALLYVGVGCWVFATLLHDWQHEPELNQWNGWKAEWAGVLEMLVTCLIAWPVLMHGEFHGE